MTVDIQKLIDQLKNFLSRDQRIMAAFLLGSVLRNDFRHDSDIDCALLLRDKNTFGQKERMTLAGELGSLVGRTVDLGVISTDNLVYAMQALSSGQLIFAHDAMAVDRKIMHIYSLYAKLREERCEVESVYGCG